MRRLKIVFLDFDDMKNHLLAGGQARATQEVAKRLVQLKHEVTVVCSRFPGSKDSFNEGIFYKHIGLGSSNIKLNNLIFFLALPFAVSKLKADVVIECFTAPISTCFSPLFTKIPVIGMPTMFEAKEFAKKYHLPFHWIEKIGSRFYKYFLAYSKNNKAKMEKLNPNIHTKIIPNGVTEEWFSVNGEDKDYALFIGRIDIVQKSQDKLLEACKLLPRNFPVKIVIAGNGPVGEEKKLKKMILDFNISRLVEFVGRVDGKKREDLMKHSMFGIYPSRFEDFPLVPLEFAALNKPLICADVLGMAWVPEKVAIKVDSNNPNNLADALVKMATDKKMRIEMKKHCRPFAKKYGWNAIAKQYEEFCYEVIKIEMQKKKGGQI